MCRPSCQTEKQKRVPLKNLVMEKSEAHSENLSPLLGYHLFSYGRMGDGEGPQAENSQKERGQRQRSMT